jgi:hypothetical protein
MSDAIEARHPVPPSPIHPLSALVTIVLDNLFGVVELVDPLAIVLTSISVGALCTVAVTLVQRYLAKEEWGPSIAKGLVMGIIAGVPWSVAGTAVGIPLLAWAGLHEWVKLPPSTEKAAPTNSDIVDAEFKEVDDNTKTQ